MLGMMEILEMRYQPEQFVGSVELEEAQLEVEFVVEPVVENTGNDMNGMIPVSEIAISEVYQSKKLRLFWCFRLTCIKNFI